MRLSRTARELLRQQALCLAVMEQQLRQLVSDSLIIRLVAHFVHAGGVAKLGVSAVSCLKGEKTITDSAKSATFQDSRAKLQLRPIFPLERMTSHSTLTASCKCWCPFWTTTAGESLLR